MKSLELDSLRSIVERDFFTKEYYYIAHLLDRVLLGKNNDDNYDTLKGAIDDGQLLELHLFNEEKEIFISRVEGKYIFYKPLQHYEHTGEKHVITRNHKIISGLQINAGAKYKTLKVKEYISYDEDSHLAFVERTVLHSLLKEVENGQI